MEPTRVGFIKAPEQGDSEEYQIEKEDFFDELKSVLDEINNKGYMRASTMGDEYIELHHSMACIDCLSEIGIILKLRDEWGNYGLTNKFSRTYPERHESSNLIGVTACGNCGRGHFMIQQ